MEEGGRGGSGVALRGLESRRGDVEQEAEGLGGGTADGWRVVVSPSVIGGYGSSSSRNGNLLLRKARSRRRYKVSIA